jgi:DNA primase
MKSDRLIEEIKSSIDIVDFISDYVQLKKAGQNYKGLCPFHPDKVPSFMVSPSKQIFHCFGCGSGGDVISFLMKHDNLSFNEAKRHIAKKAGIPLTEPQRSTYGSEKRDKLLSVQREAAKFFKENLKSSDGARSYLKKRGIDDTSVDRFHIGYAPNEKTALLHYLKEKGYTDPSIKDAGLVVADKHGYRDTFRGRIMFPICNMRGDIIAFGGRVMHNALPKYLNSPETDIFKKAETLFAVDLAKDAIRKKEYALVVEGYLDTIICHHYGFQNTVSPLGTALTLGQMRKLKVLTSKVIVVFDGDEAGIAAAQRSLPILSACDLRARILLLPQGEDPDSYLRKNGGRAFQKLLSNTMSMVQFLIEVSGKDTIDKVRESLVMIAAGNDLIIADEMIKELADRSGISESVLRSELGRMKKKEKRSTSKEVVPDKTMKYAEEYLLLSALLSFPEKIEEVISQLNSEDLRELPVKSLFEKVKALGANFNMDTLINEATEEEQSIIRELTLNPGFDFACVDRNIHDCLLRLAQRRLDERRNLLMAQDPHDVALYDSLLKEKRKLIKERKL